MTDANWLAGLQLRINDANRRLVSTFANLQAERKRISDGLDTVIDRLARVSAAREQATASQLHDRVLQAFQEQRFEHLTLREQRYAAKRFESAQPQQMQRFLAVHPSSWEPFARECFRRWDELASSPNQSAYARLLCLAPNTVAFVHQGVPLPDLVGPSGPTLLARTIKARELSPARVELHGRGWDAGWSFTAIALAMWTRLCADAGETFDSLWSAIADDLIAEAMLLPRLPSQLRSWFSERLRPARIRGGVSANAVFISSLLRAAIRSGVGPTNWSSFCEALLRSEFRDLRVPPESTGWAMVKRFDPDYYQRFLELLISEDLEVFFDHAMRDPRRRKFWLRYLGSLRRTTCILDGSTYERLKRQLAGAEKKMAAALSRARQFSTRGGSASAQAFCLYFDNVVIVEFSETGNAAYIYGRADFEKHFERAVHDNQLRDHNKLKMLNLSRDRIIHSSTNWERNTTRALSQLGIYPDR